MVKSPCTNICTMSLDGKLCMGCGRSIEEITNWSYFSNEEKKKLLKKYLINPHQKNSNK